MTTVNVRIERLDSGDRLYLQNGHVGAGDQRPARIRPGLDPPSAEKELTTVRDHASA